MKRIILFAFVWMVGANIIASATIINILDDYSTIQQGIDASTDGDTVLVQPNIYYEHIHFNMRNVTVGSLFLTTGDMSYISSTIIDGDSWTYVVTLVDVDSSAIIIGFTIRNGGSGIRLNNNADATIRYNIISGNSNDLSGGGIYCSDSNPIIDNNIITGNSAPIGGIYLNDHSNLIVSNNIISGNSGDNGGGIFCRSSNPTIRNNIINENLASVNGGGIFCEYSNPSISDNVISENSAGNYGGGIFCWESDPTIINNNIRGNSSVDGGGINCRNESRPTIGNNIIFDNYASDQGGGIYSYYTSVPTISNNIISRNIAGNQGGGIFFRSTDPTIINTIIWENIASEGEEIFAMFCEPVVTYCDVRGGWEGEGNIDTDPLFRDAENDDFRLMSLACGDTLDSPCIDTGSPAIIDSLLDCSWGLGTILSDMGAYGGGDSVTMGTDDHHVVVPRQFALTQNYPNPFNSRTIIQYNLPVASDVAIVIYDILGRKVETLVQEEQQAGYHQVVWDASDQSSGVYFYRIQAGEFAETKKMLLLK